MTEQSVETREKSNQMCLHPLTAVSKKPRSLEKIVDL